MVNTFRYIIFLLLAGLFTGCAESTFNLSSDSRLPKWFDIPNGMTRDDVKVEMSYYVKPNKREAKFKLLSKRGVLLKRVTGTQIGSKPYKLGNIDSKTSIENQHLYEIIMVNGITEIIEHKRAEPVFYISDDLRIREKLMDKIPK